jgi:hypothetical protein
MDWFDVIQFRDKPVEKFRFPYRWGNLFDDEEIITFSASLQKSMQTSTQIWRSPTTVLQSAGRALNQPHRCTWEPDSSVRHQILNSCVYLRRAPNAAQLSAEDMRVWDRKNELGYNGASAPLQDLQTALLRV